MSVNYVELLDKIKSNTDNIILFLEKLGYKDARVVNNERVAARNPDGDNQSALCVYIDSLKIYNYTRNISGNLISLVMHDTHSEFQDAIKLMARWLNFKGSNIIIKPPFSGFYKNLAAEQSGGIPLLSEYPIELLPDPNNFSLKWIKDGINIDTQKTFNISMDFNENGIVVPEYDINNRLIGAKWRNNDPTCDMSERWNMFLKFNQSYNLYGLNINCPQIIKKGKVIVVESEKSVMQLYSWGCGLGVSVNGHNISRVQQTLLKSLMASEVIICFDNDVCSEECEYKAKQLITDNIIYKNKISFVRDKEGLLGEKDSPTDRGRETFQQLFKERIFVA